jgi:hypothetical protein
MVAFGAARETVPPQVSRSQKSTAFNAYILSGLTCNNIPAILPRRHEPLTSPETASRCPHSRRAKNEVDILEGQRLLFVVVAANILRCGVGGTFIGQSECPRF